MDNIILPHGGYQSLRSYRKSLIVYDATVCFCRRFLTRGDRTIDQMTQAARSEKQNIVEGSMASAISKETEIKLTGVARASLQELLEDYLGFLRTRKLPLWKKDSKAALKIRSLGSEEDESYLSYESYFESRSPGTVANIIICLVHQCNYLLDKQLAGLAAEFPKHGGLRERMFQSRIKERNK
ncbi:MAG: four helix bundle protein [Lentisphaerae bacterium GWF2_45_14]|nr:MAG: four helix bundle protein [Lentisphaerae bacterium GWF2_45_14]